jgi:NAD(P)-dependent dehydrogenase (short-subunit alcohol dehydrogenase family)
MVAASVRVAIVTGAAGGVGRSLVKGLRSRDYAVIAEDISDGVKGLADGDEMIVPLQADAAQSDSARQAVELARSRFGRLDQLVNNAARFVKKSLADSTDEDFDRLIATNLRSAFVHAREAVPELNATNGNIVNVASTSGLVGQPNQVLYCMTKGAIVQLTRQLAIEHADRGIRVNAVAPGAIDTDFIAEARAADPDPERTAAETIARHPIGRLMTPDEVAEAIIFLASDAASAITGSILSVVGGYVAR